VRVPEKQYNNLAKTLKRPPLESAIPDNIKYFDYYELISHTYFKKEWGALTHVECTFIKNTWQDIIIKELGKSDLNELTKQDVFQFEKKYRLRLMLIQPNEEVS